MSIYLDHAATTPLDPRVQEAMAYCEAISFANSNSLHGPGQEAAEQLRQARATIARCLNIQADAILLTSGGTEANNLALLGLARASKSRGRHLITTAIEHSAVLEPLRYMATHEDFSLTILPVNGWGQVDPADVERAVRPDTVLVSVMHANNEVGTLQPIAEIGQRLRALNVLFHVDAVQTVGKLPLDLSTLPVDALSCSAHKLYGPKGIGFLYLNPDVVRPVPLQFGGSQEGGLRGGTTPVSLAVGLATALELACERQPEYHAHLSALTDEFIAELLAILPTNAVFNTPLDPGLRLPGIVNLSLAPTTGDQWVLRLGMRGIAIASGSACHAGSIEPSHVLLAMDRDPMTARSSLRFSLGRGTTRQELQVVIQQLSSLMKITYG